MGNNGVNREKDTIERKEKTNTEYIYIERGTDS
jgi:hypothetical protein